VDQDERTVENDCDAPHDFR